MKDAKVAAGVELCRECLGLRGPCFDTFSHCERTQRCSCEPKEPLCASSQPHGASRTDFSQGHGATPFAA